MEVKEAVTKAKEYITDLFDAEDLANVGLEEVEFDESKDEWHVTIGFSRPWDRPRNVLTDMATSHLKRSYKVVRIDNASGRVKAVSERKLSDA